MEKRRIAILLVAIGLAVLGLVVVQIMWLRKTMELKETQFAHSMDNVLYSVSERMERVERMRELRRHGVGRRMLVRLDSLRVKGGRTMELKEAAHERNAFENRVPPAPPGPLANDTEALAPPGVRTFEWEEQEVLVTDMVRGILAAEVGRNIRQRIDVHLLDSLVTLELKAAGIEEGWSYGVYTATGERIPLTLERNMDTTGLADTPFRERLFPHDVAGKVHYLHLVVPNEGASLFAGMLAMLLFSVLFISIIAWAFGFTIRTIYRQKRISDIRTDLVNNLTHELKTPISTIGLACEALADPSMPKSEEQVRTYTAMIRAENKRLGSLVENVLQSAVLDSGQMVLKPVDLDIHSVINDVVRSSTMLVNRRNGHIELDLAAEIHSLKADRIHLTNLLYNLIDNAVKYTEKEPRVRIATTSNDQGITVRVIDNGIGIAAGEHRKIFDRLYRVPTGNLHNAKGFGLGLSYVRTVVERHGGRIKVESAPGQGSTFQLFLPFEHVQATETSARRG